MDIYKNQQIKNILYRIFVYMFFISFSWLFINCIIITRVRYYNIDDRLTFIPIIICLLITFSLYILYKMYNKSMEVNISIRQLDIFASVLLAISFLIQLIVGYSLAVYPDWDFKNVFDAASIIANNGIYSGEYFIQHPNNLGLLVSEIFIFRIAKFLGCNNFLNISIFVNSVFITSSMTLMYIIAKNIFSCYKAILSLIVMVCFIPLYLYIPIIYTDTFSMPFGLLILYFYIKLYKTSEARNKALLLFFITLSAFIGYKLKTSIIIILIGIIIHIFLTKQLKEFIKVTGIIVILFLIFNNAFSIYLKNCSYFSYSYTETKDKNFPYQHYIMMGLNEGNFGGFSGEDQEDTLKYLEGKNNRECKEHNIDIIRERIQNMGIYGLFSHLTKKAVWTWGDGLYVSDMMLLRNPISNSLLYKLITEKGIVRTIISYISQVLQMLLLLLLICSSIKDIVKKNKNIMVIDSMKISIFGVFILLLLWETSSRYLINFIPVCILVAVDGLGYLMSILTNRKKYKLY